MEPHSYQASITGKILDGMLAFLPDWLAITIIALIFAAVLATWITKLVRKIQYRRAVRSGRPVHAAAQHGQRPGSDYLGSYAPPPGDGPRA